MNWLIVSIRHGRYHTNCSPAREPRAAARFVLDGPMRANCPNIEVHEMGPCEMLPKRAFRPLCANPNQSARSVHLHCGPMRAFGLAAITLTAGPHDSLVREPFLCLMGQCELIAQILWYMKWAHARSCTRGSPGFCGPTHARRQRQCIFIAGQCELVVQIIQCMEWANPRACARLLSRCGGPTRADRQGQHVRIVGPLSS